VVGVDEGDDSLTLPIMSVGGKGVISVVANLVPKDVSSLCAAALRGDWVEARRLHHKLYPLSKAMFVETSPIPVKTAMGWLDLCAPDVRPPLASLEKPSLEKLEKTLREYGLVGPRRKHPVC
jgi:4-hydroxy-tetrahydrodipicolinate synthase